MEDIGFFPSDSTAVPAVTYSGAELIIHLFILTTDTESLSQTMERLQAFSSMAKLNERWMNYGTLGIIGFLFSQAKCLKLSRRLMEAARKIVPRYTVFEFLSKRIPQETIEDTVVFNAWYWVMYGDKFNGVENDNWIRDHAIDDSILRIRPVRRALFPSPTDEVE